MGIKRILLCFCAGFGTLARFWSVASAIPVSPISLQEAASSPTQVQYTLVNNTHPANPCDIVGFVVSDPGGSNPSTTNSGWATQSLTATDWTQPMGGAGSGLESWQQLTGRSFTDVFLPVDPCVGYFMFYKQVNGVYVWPGNPSYGGGLSGPPAGSAVLPGDSQAGFSRDGVVGSTFLAFGPSDITTFSADPNAAAGTGMKTFSGIAQTPEPAMLSLMTLSALGLLRGRRSA